LSSYVSNEKLLHKLITSTQDVGHRTKNVQSGMLDILAVTTTLTMVANNWARATKASQQACRMPYAAYT